MVDNNKNYQRMNEQFEKNLERLKDRPQRYLLDVKVKGRQYELEVYADTTLEKIVNRYEMNGFYDSNESVIKVLVGGKQTDKTTQIKNLVNSLKQISNVKIQLVHESKNEHSRHQAQSLLQQSEVKVYQGSQSIMLQNQKKKNSQYKAEPEKISVKQLEVLIESMQKKLKVQERFKDYQTIINNYTVELNSTITKDNKIIKNLQNFISFLGNKIQLFHKQRKVNAYSMVGSKIMDENSKKQIITLDRIQKKINDQLQLIMKPNQNDTVTQELIQYFKGIKNLMSKQKEQNFALFAKKFQSVNGTIKKISQSIVNDFRQMKNSQSREIQNLNKKITNLNDKIKVLQKQLQKPKTVISKNDGIKLRTSFINNLQQEKKIIFLKDEIQKYEGHSIDCLETVLEFNKCQIINFQIIVNLLDESSLSPFSRILMIIGVDNESFMVYSTKGIFREGSSIKISQAEKGTAQNCCLQGAGFLILGNELKKFENSNGKLVNSIIKYNKKILSIGNRLNMLYSAKKKIEMIYKSSTQACQLQDNNNELENALKNKKLEVMSIQIYKVMLNYKIMCEASFTGSTQATMSSYRKEYGY